MLNQLFVDPLMLGLAQAAAAILLALIVLWVARRQSIHLERETIIALARGIIQVTAAGSVLLLLFQAPGWTSVVVLVVMTLIAAQIASQRIKSVRGAFWVSLQGIGFGAGIVIASMTLVGVIEAEMRSLIPLGSMLIANSMNTTALALERFYAEVESHSGRIEAALALGATPGVTVAAHVQAAVAASLIPRIDNLRSLGIVWLPGVMTGMILAGSDPIYAAIYQFVVIAMIYAGSGLTAVASVLLFRGYVFTPADQLQLRAKANGKANNTGS
jgi:putative ABC transport system permease protein